MSDKLKLVSEIEEEFEIQTQKGPARIIFSREDASILETHKRYEMRLNWESIDELLARVEHPVLRQQLQDKFKSIEEDVNATVNSLCEKLEEQ